MKISARLWLIVCLAILGMVAVVGASLYEIKGELLADRQIKTKHIVDVAHSVVAYYQDLEKSGKLSKEDAQSQALAAIAAIRYDKGDYIWINDYSVVILSHPVAKLVGFISLSRRRRFA